MYIIPSQKDKRWIQSNASEFYGNVSSTRNIDFLKEGYASLSQRTYYVNDVDSVMKRDASDDFTDVVSIVYDAKQSEYFVLGAAAMFDLPLTLDDATLDSGANKPTPVAYGDALYFNGEVVVTDATTIRARDNGTWDGAAKVSDLDSGFPHPLCVFENFNYLAVGNKNTVRLYNTSYALQATLTIPDEFEVRWMRYLNNNLYVGTRNKSNRDAFLFVWSGGGSTADGGGFPTYGANWMFAGCNYKSTIAIVTNLGQLLAFNGGGFDVLDNFPVYYTPYEWFRNGSYDSVMVQRGMLSQGENILMNIDNGLILQAPYYLENQPSGVWQYKPRTGLHHKYSPSNFKTSSTNDFGSPQILRVGAMSLLVHPMASTSLPAVTVGGGLLFGARVYNNVSTTSNVLVSLASGENRGMIQTARLYSENVTNKWSKIYVKYQGVMDATDKIIVKYRTTTRNAIPTGNFTTSTENAVTWTSTTVFTTTSANFANVLAGDEVTVLRGSGAGSMAQISTITENAGTYTVTLDQAINGVSANDTGSVTVNNWTYAGGSLANSTITSSDTDGFKEFNLVNLGASRWIQVKLELRGQDVQIEELQVIDATQKPSK